MKEKKLKLYVWEDVLTDYTSGIMFALATSADEARGLILEKCNYVPSVDLAKEPQCIETPEAFCCGVRSIFMPRGYRLRN